MPSCLKLSITSYGSRVKGSNPANRIKLSPSSRCICYWKGSLGVALDYIYTIIIIIIMSRCDFSDSLAQSVPIIHPYRQVFQTPSLDSIWRYFFVGRSNLACLCVGVHWRTPLMSSIFLLQQSPAYFIRLTYMVLKWEVSGRTAVVLSAVASRNSS